MLEVVNDLLLIGYEDGLMDVMDNDLNITTFEDIFESELSGDKKINEAVIVEDIIYLATDFGVVLYNVEENELIDLFRIWERVVKELPLTELALIMRNYA